MTQPPLQSAADYECVWTGSVRDVRLSPKCAAAYKEAIEKQDDISVKRKKHLERYFEEYCNQERPRLTDEKFKKEGKFPDGKGTKASISAFKAWQFRIYGTEMTVAGKRTFVGVEVDDSKKKDKADQNKLREAARALAKLAEY